MHNLTGAKLVQFEGLGEVWRRGPDDGTPTPKALAAARSLDFAAIGGGGLLLLLTDDRGVDVHIQIDADGNIVQVDTCGATLAVDEGGHIAHIMAEKSDDS